MLFGLSQWAKSPKNSRSAYFVNSALKIQCHIVENSLGLQTAFSTILPTGIVPLTVAPHLIFYFAFFLTQLKSFYLNFSASSIDLFFIVFYQYFSAIFPTGILNKTINYYNCFVCYCNRTGFSQWRDSNKPSEIYDEIYTRDHHGRRHDIIGELFLL